MLRPIHLEATVSAVSIYDDAFDVEKARAATHDHAMPDGASKTFNGVQKYSAERMKNPGCWREFLPVKDGQSPTEFIIGVIPPGELTRMEDEARLSSDTPRPGELHWRAFLSSVREIKNSPWQDVPTDEIGGVRYVRASWLAKQFAGRLRQVALDIGFQAWSWNQVAEVEVKN